MRMNQVTLPVTDLARSVDFYRRLGLIQIVGGPGTYARFELPDGDATLSLHELDDVTGRSGTVVYFECDDLDRTVERLRRSGIEFTSGPQDMRWLWREARLVDPDGNELCLFRAGDNRRNPPWRMPQASPTA